MDSSAEMLERARAVEVGCGVEFVVADVQQFVATQVGDESPDVIFCSLGLHYVDAAPLAEVIIRHTSRGSRLAFSVPHDAETPLTRAFDEAWRWHVGSALPISSWGLDDLLAWMRSAGSLGTVTRTVECPLSTLTLSEAWAAVYPKRAPLLGQLHASKVDRIKATFGQIVQSAQSRAPQAVTVHLAWSGMLDGTGGSDNHPAADQRGTPNSAG